ncbi:MAG TPA: DUF2461 domain-containing protein [Candidatus Absconditabacterales bacterium]|nr:DUF2461 domain-containing protein [Candidatus Absconditabacterales bacterium]HMT26748.1 DUF2461 domain-containing protein [Candidatus Absconditabacterales bacterium]
MKKIQISDALFPFLRAVKENNNTKWLHLHDDLYREERKLFTDFVDAILDELKKLNPELFGELEAKKCLFRFNRDVRFGHDKSPYKTNFSAVFALEGKKSPYAKFYVSLEPDGKSFIGGGLYYPDASVLKKIRNFMLSHRKTYQNIISQPDFLKIFGSVQGESTKTMPRGFDKSHPAEKIIRMKAWYVGVNLSDKEVMNGDMVKKTIEFYKKIQTFLELLNKAVES